MKKYLFTFLLFFAYTLVFAQKDFRPGYIIQNGQTIQGLVDYRSEQRNAVVCLFKPSEEAAAQRLTPEQVTGYGYNDGKRYEALPVPAGAGKTQRLFLNVLVKGSASLFYYRDSTLLDHYYLQTAETLQELQETTEYKTNARGEKVRVTNHVFRKVLADSFKACPSVYKQIQESRLKESSLIAVVAAYNRCAAPSAALFVREPLKSKFTWGPVIGINNSVLKIISDTYLGQAEYTSDINFQGGISVNMTVPRLSEKLSVHADLLYSSQQHSGQYSDQGTGWIAGIATEYEISFDFKYLKLPIQLRYTFPKGKYKPFINAGIMNGYALELKQEAIKTTKVVGSTTYMYRDIILPFQDYRKYTQGLTFGGGFTYPVSKKYALLAEARYEMGNGISYYSGTSTNLNTLALLIGLRL